MRDEYGQRRSSGVGKFFLGLFIGILLTIGLLAGAISLVYFKASLNTFHVDINNDTLEKYTPNDLVKLITNIAKNKDNMSIQEIGDDFGLSVPNNVHGINIEDIITCPLSEITSTVKNKVNSISASDLDGILPDKLDGLFSSTTTFEYRDGNLYEEGSSTPVNFNFTVDGNILTIKGQSYSIQADNKVEIEGTYLPLTFVLKDVTNKTVGEILNFKEVAGKLLDSAGNEVKGIMKVLSQFAISDLSQNIKDLELSKLFDYVEKDGVYYQDENAVATNYPVPQIMQTLANTKVSELGGIMTNLTISQILEKDKLQQGPLSLLDEETLNKTTLEDLPKKMVDVFYAAKLSTLVEKEIVSKPSWYDKEGMAALKDYTLSELIDLFNKVDASILTAALAK